MAGNDGSKGGTGGIGAGTTVVKGLVKPIPTCCSKPCWDAKVKQLEQFTRPLTPIVPALVKFPVPPLFPVALAPIG